MRWIAGGIVRGGCRRLGLAGGNGECLGGFLLVGGGIGRSSNLETPIGIVLGQASVVGIDLEDIVVPGCFCWLGRRFSSMLLAMITTIEAVVVASTTLKALTLVAVSNTLEGSSGRSGFLDGNADGGVLVDNVHENFGAFSLG